jgi:hypothetical protein
MNPFRVKALNKPLFTQIQPDEVVITNTEEKPASQDVIPTVVVATSTTEGVQTEEQPTDATTEIAEPQAEETESTLIPEGNKVNDENENPFAL